ncbi:MAG TPA: zinc-binding dehydrogenase [bacterium]|nr:zinc-binding dehydrogenase [bacterium]
MKAMLLTEYGSVEGFRWGELPLPEPGPDDVRIRVEAISLNPVDYKMRQGRIAGPLPVVLGRDVAGRVDAVGANVKRFRPGDAVLAVLFGPRSNGAYAEYVCTPEPFVSTLPRGVEPLRAVTLGVAAVTAWEVVMLRPSIEPGRPVFVAGGSGGVGSFAVPLARMRGAAPILATAGSDASADYLTQALGVPPQDILRYRGRSLEELAAWVRERTDGRGVAAALDLVGGDMKRLCFQVLDFHGCAVSCVEEYEPDFGIDIWSPQHSPLYARSASYHYVAVSAPARFGTARDWAIYPRMFAGLIDAVESGALPLPPVQDMGVLDEETLRAAHRLLETGHARGKLVLRVG